MSFQVFSGEKGSFSSYPNALGDLSNPGPSGSELTLVTTVQRLALGNNTGTTVFDTDIDTTFTNDGSDWQRNIYTISDVGLNSVAIGINAAMTGQSVSSVAIGPSAGKENQSGFAVAIGQSSGKQNQSAFAIAIGKDAGRSSQGTGSIAIGDLAGDFNQGSDAVAIGSEAGSNLQGSNSVCIGKEAGNASQGTNSVCIGYQAGFNTCVASAIILNGSGADLPAATQGLFVKPIAPEAAGTLKSLYYNPTTGQITYD